MNSAFLIKITKKNVVESASLVYGNLDPNFSHATETEKYLVGKNAFSDDVLQEAIKVLSKELKPVDIAGEPSAESRKKLALGLFYKVL